jgi:NAD(P)H dehydrogenase (quinone)
VILVTGASGHLGKHVAALLSERGVVLRLLVRDPSKAPGGVRAEVVAGDYGDAESLSRAFVGVDTAFLVSASAPPGMRAKLHAAAFAAAGRAGIRHVVYLSLQGSAPDSRYPFSRDHWESEQSLRASGVAHTILRNGKYTEQLLEPEMVGADGVMRGPPGEGRIAWISRRDSARVIAELLPKPPGGIVTYTGPEALTLRETATRLSASFGRPLRWEEEAPEGVRARVCGRAARNEAPLWRAALWAGAYRAIAAGDYAPIHDAATWIGRSERLEDTVASGALSTLFG